MSLPDERARRAEAVQRKGEPVTDDQGPTPFGYPTLSMSLEIKRQLPPQGVKWLYVKVIPMEIRNGRFDTNVYIYNEDMQLVAKSHQVSLIVDVSRRATKLEKQKNKL